MRQNPFLDRISFLAQVSLPAFESAYQYARLVGPEDEARVVRDQLDAVRQEIARLERESQQWLASYRSNA